MTSAKLLDYVRTHHVLQALKLDVISDEIYRAANFAQSEILQECELLDEYVTPAFVANKELYSSADSGWEFLAHAVRVKFGQLAASPFKPLKPKTKEWVDQQRFLVANGYTKPQPPLWFYHTLTNPLSLGFWGEPAEVESVNLTIVRGHSDTDDISDAKAPLIPMGYDELMVFGTVLKLVEFRATSEEDKGEFTQSLIRLQPRFADMKMRAKLTRTMVAGRTLSLKGVRA